MKNVIVLVLALIASPAFATGDAGCGLGSMIITKNTKLLQLFAATTNGFFGSQTFGITSGTSNCSANGIVKNEKQIQYFVEVNQEDLTREMAQGRGDKLATLAALNGCLNDQAISEYSNAAQSRFEQIVPSSKVNAVDMVKNLKASSIADVCTGS